MRIGELIDLIEQKKLVLPDFQREYVWTREHARQLMVSLINQYPIGSLLFWETHQPPVLRNLEIVNQSRDQKLYKLILDGQQRLTALYLLLKDAVPFYYSADEIDYDPRDLYFHLKTTYFEFYQAAKMRADPYWVRVTDCFQGQLPNFSQAELPKLRRNLDRLLAIPKRTLPIETVKSKFDLTGAIEIFDRVNVQGLPLTSAELVLAHITSQWPEARQQIKTKRDQLATDNFEFDLEFFTRGILLALTQTSLYANINSYFYQQFKRIDYELAWQKLTQTLDFLIAELKKYAHLNSLDALSDYYSLIPMLAYLFKYGDFARPAVRQGFWHWMFLTMIWERYRGALEQRLEKDVFIATQHAEPVQMLVKEIEKQKGRTRLKSSDLEDHGAGHALHKMLYTVIKWKKARDWVDNQLWSEKSIPYSDVHSQHIFPQNLLYTTIYHPHNLEQRLKVHEIANRAFLTQSSEYEFAHLAPAEYLKRFKEEDLISHLIPIELDLWQVEKYEEFLEARRRLIAQSINEYFTTFGFHTHGVVESADYTQLIAQGESNYVEFKSILHGVEYAVVKTIAAFLNTGGGVLLIGVGNNKEVIGLKSDYRDLKDRQDPHDSFYLYFTHVVSSYLGKDVNAYVIPKIVGLQDQEICLVEVNESPYPIFVKKDGQKRFYIRAAASSEPLSPRETREYIRAHW